MGAATPLVSQITNYLGQLNQEQQRAVLGVVKTFAREEPWLSNKQYLAEMDKRFAEMENGKVKGISFDELKTHARQSYKKTKRIK
jgi:hypothetical protein